MKCHKWNVQVVIILLLLGSAIDLRAQDLSSQNLPVLTLSPGESVKEIRSFIRYQTPFSSPTQNLISIPLFSKLQSIQASNIQFGSPKGKVLVLLKVKNNGSRDGSWIFSTNRGSLKHIQMFELKDQSVESHFNSDDLGSVKNNLQKYHSFSFELNLKKGEESTIGIIFEAENSTSMPITIQTLDEFYESIMIQGLIMAIVATGIVILILFNSILFLSAARKAFVYIIIAEVAYLFQSIHIQGYTTIYIFYDNPGLARSLAEAAKCIFAFCMAMFAKNFLNTAKFTPLIDKLLTGIIVLACTCFILLLFRSFWSESTLSNIHFFAWAVAILSGLFMPVVAVKAILLKGWIHWPLLVSWGIMGLFIADIALASAGLIPSLPYQWHWTGPVGLLESFFLTVMIGLYVRNTEKEALETQVQLTLSLEEKFRIEKDKAVLSSEKIKAIEGLDQQKMFIHASGHDSKQVLLALQSVTTVLEQTEDGKISNNAVKILQSSSEYLKQIISTSMASTIATGYSPQLLAVSLKSINDFLHTIKLIYKNQAQNKGILLRIESQQNQCIVSDFSLLSRMLSNLVNNAIKFSSSGEVVITTSCDVKNMLGIIVTDQGRGMSPETIDILLDNSINRHRVSEEQEGSGSGFSSVRHIVSRLGGTIHIQSKIDQGTTIAVSIPDLANIYTHDKISKNDRAADVLLFDPDNLNENVRRRKLNEMIVKNPQKEIVFTTHNDSVILREWMNEHASLVLYKPVGIEVLNHPVIQKLLFNI